MENNIVIEEATFHSEELHTAIKHLVRQLGEGGQELMPEDTKQMIESPTTYLFLAKVQETAEIVGMITLITYRIPYKMKGILEDFVVDESFRGKKIGEKLLHHALEKARSLSISSVDLTSHPSREAANKLYNKLGFEKRETNVYRVHL